MATRDFRTLFCERFGCPPSEYEERIFRQCLYAHAKLLAPLARRLNPEFFKTDFKLLQYLGLTTTPQEITNELADFRDANHKRKNFFRTGLKIRVSGRKVASVAQKVYARERPKR